MEKNEGSIRPPWAFVGAVVLAGAALTLGASWWPGLLLTTGFSGQAPFVADAGQTVLHPFAELLKLVMAALAGFAVTAVHRYYHRDKPIPRSLLQAQVLLCVAGALVMIIIYVTAHDTIDVLGGEGGALRDEREHHQPGLGLAIVIERGQHQAQKDGAHGCYLQ